MNAEQHVPPFRFKGFSDFWEQRKLSDLAMFNPRLELPDSFQYVDLESVSGTELINHRTETKSSAPSRAQRLAKKGDIFYQTVRPYQKNNYLVLVQIFLTDLILVYWVPRNEGLRA